MTSPQTDLFGAGPVLPDGFRYTAGLITPSAETALVEQIRRLPFKDFEFHGFTGRRRVVSFGWQYDFDERALRRADDMPDFLVALRETAAAVRASGETFLGARLDGRLVGAVSYKRRGGVVDIHRLVVHPDAFRRGLATRLLDALEARAQRLVGVWGNNDHGVLRERLPEVARVEIEGIRLGVVHETGAAKGREARCSAQYPELDVLVFGHSHIPWDTTAPNGLRLLNPGSPTDRRRQPHCTYLTATALDGELRDVALHPVLR
jgi:putative phosphoesterase